MQNRKKDSSSGMEQVRRFDKMYLEMEKDNIMLMKIGIYFMEVLMTMAFLLTWDGELPIFNKMGASCFYICVLNLHIRIYMTIREEGKEAIGIYDMLAYTPVEPRDIFRVRKEYINKMLWKRLFILYGLQLPFIFLKGSISVENICVPIGTILIAMLLLYGEIMPPKKRKKRKNW